MDILTKYIKKTDNQSLDVDELIYIIDHINNIVSTIDNLNLLLKLISNLISYPDFIDFNLDKLLENKWDMLNDGHIISLIKIYCSQKYSNPLIAIKLTNDYSVHKTSSYIPIFEYLIKINDHTLIKLLYIQLNSMNKQIINSNRLIKESNYKTRLYNENIKLLKLKYNELTTIMNTLRDIQLENNPYINKKLDNFSFVELKHQTEQNIIQLSDQIINNILQIAIKNSDNDLILCILTNIDIIDPLMIKLLTDYYTNFHETHIELDNICDCCHQKTTSSYYITSILFQG
jgi:hypothetical protein